MIYFALVLRTVVRRRRAVHDLHQLQRKLRQVDLQAFCNLVNSQDEQYLRERLPAREFRKVQRLRARAAAEYVRHAAANALVMLQIAEAARASADGATALAAQQVVNSAVRLRLYALVVLVRLNAEIVFPGVLTYSLPFARAYEQTLGSFANLSQMAAA